MLAPALPFESLYAHGFLRVAVCTPRVDVAAPQFNLEQTLELARRASASSAAVALFPELGLAAYSNEDLVAQDALLDGVEAAVAALVRESAELFPLLIVGAPLRTEQKLFNCALVIHRGEILGVETHVVTDDHPFIGHILGFQVGCKALGSTSQALKGVIVRNSPPPTVRTEFDFDAHELHPCVRRK